MVKQVLFYFGIDYTYKYGNYTITFQYVDEAVWAVWGEYERIEIKLAYDQGYSIIHQERFHSFRKK